VKEDLDSAKRYRHRADQLRTMAKGAGNGNRKAILDVATDYDDMFPRAGAQRRPFSKSPRAAKPRVGAASEP
jgi:hypothetical protein